LPFDVFFTIKLSIIYFNLSLHVVNGRFFFIAVDNWHRTRHDASAPYMAMQHTSCTVDDLRDVPGISGSHAYHGYQDVAMTNRVHLPTKKAMSVERFERELEDSNVH
jgi:hypothetical protein